MLLYQSFMKWPRTELKERTIQQHKWGETHRWYMYFMCLCISSIFYVLPSSWRLCKTRWRRAMRLWGDLRTSWSRGSASCRPWRWSWRVCTNRWAASPEEQNDHMNTPRNMRGGFLFCKYHLQKSFLVSTQRNWCQNGLAVWAKNNRASGIYSFRAVQTQSTAQRAVQTLQEWFKNMVMSITSRQSQDERRFGAKERAVLWGICLITQKILTEVRIQSQFDQFFNLCM